MKRLRALHLEPMNKQEEKVKELQNQGGKIIMIGGPSGRVILEMPDTRWAKVSVRGDVDFDDQ